MSERTRLLAVLSALALLAAAACNGGSRMPGPVTATNHAFFPVAAGSDHAYDCAACHTSASTFSVFTCTGCHAHDQAPMDLVHGGAAGYAYASTDCYQCHSTPVRGPFPLVARDPAQDVAVSAGAPTWAGAAIAMVTTTSQALPMPMNHGTLAIPGGMLGDCAACHTGVEAGAYYPGVLHASLASQGAAQPATCSDCHAGSAPSGFVGAPATSPVRAPPSGEMKHDAVAWSGGAPTATPLVTADCGVCHASPANTAFPATWKTAAAGPGAPKFHPSLSAAGLPQPASCTDCHANSRPAAGAGPGGFFDHTTPAALGECAACHGAAAAASGFSAWSGASFHVGGSPSPTSCLPCHQGTRPASAAGWQSTTYQASPFDYGTHVVGLTSVTHGDGQDCALCHLGPGTGGTDTWVGGHFDHGPSSIAVAGATCVVCHASQRPDLQPWTTPAAMASLLGFDHAANGTGDCSGCHQATVAAGHFARYLPPAAPAAGSSDWAGGAGYPGALLVSAPDSIYAVTELALTRTGARVTGWTTTTATLYGGMTHVSAAIPSQVTPTPPSTNCWHCHLNTNGAVTSFAGGQFHPKLTSYSATPGGAVTPIAQPTSHCADCHGPMRPVGIVQRAGSNLRPMDHAALFTGPVTIGGITTTSAAGLDCSTCHASPGVTWADGVFHASTATATPADCTVCHYPLMSASANVTVPKGSLTNVMAHGSPLVTVQRCDVCHATAIANATAATLTAALWAPGAYHASVGAQPGACVGCHGPTVPSVATQSSVVYSLVVGPGTTTNGGQWMNHAATGVAGVDCVTCHAADATATASAWSKSTAFHAHVASPGTCQACHGLTNGNGTVAGTNNNLPATNTDSSTITTAASDPTTGVPAGTHDQISHTDVNVTGHDCAFCHTQVGPSTVAGVQGLEWAKAKLHASFTTGSLLLLNGTTGRCSDCHLNVKPTATFTAQDHSTFTSAAGTQDCNPCHAWPGTGTAAAPNWLGGGVAPQYIVVGGFTVPNPPASPPTTQAGIASLPHPSTATTGCSTCHTGSSRKPAMAYDHAATTLVKLHCTACHETGSNLVGTPWNGATALSAGAGDTRPITLASVPATNGVTETYPNHFYLDRAGAQVDCGNCHVTPTGLSVTTTGTAYSTAWRFQHPPQTPTQNFCYQCHPNGPP